MLKPDLIMLHNADLYMCTWRRTLAEMLQQRRPVVVSIAGTRATAPTITSTTAEVQRPPTPDQVTMYCEFEGRS